MRPHSESLHIVFPFAVLCQITALIGSVGTTRTQERLVTGVFQDVGDEVGFIVFHVGTTLKETLPQFPLLSHKAAGQIENVVVCFRLSKSVRQSVALQREKKLPSTFPSWMLKLLNFRIRAMVI